MITATAVMMTILAPKHSSACLGAETIMTLLQVEFDRDPWFKLRSCTIVLPDEDDIMAVLDSRGMRNIITEAFGLSIYFQRTTVGKKNAYQIKFDESFLPVNLYR